MSSVQVDLIRLEGECDDISIDESLFASYRTGTSSAVGPH